MLQFRKVSETTKTNEKHLVKASIICYNVSQLTKQRYSWLPETDVIQWMQTNWSRWELMSTNLFRWTWQVIIVVIQLKSNGQAFGMQCKNKSIIESDRRLMANLTNESSRAIIKSSRDLHGSSCLIHQQKPCLIDIERSICYTLTPSLAKTVKW